MEPCLWSPNNIELFGPFCSTIRKRGSFQLKPKQFKPITLSKGAYCNKDHILCHFNHFDTQCGAYNMPFST